MKPSTMVSLGMICMGFWAMLFLATRPYPEPENFRLLREACEAEGGVVIKIESANLNVSSIRYACVPARLVYSHKAP